MAAPQPLLHLEARRPPRGAGRPPSFRFLPLVLVGCCFLYFFVEGEKCSTSFRTCSLVLPQNLMSNHLKTRSGDFLPTFAFPFLVAPRFRSPGLALACSPLTRSLPHWLARSLAHCLARSLALSLTSSLPCSLARALADSLARPLASSELAPARSLFRSLLPWPSGLSLDLEPSRLNLEINLEMLKYKVHVNVEMLKYVLYRKC